MHCWTPLSASDALVACAGRGRQSGGQYDAARSESDALHRAVGLVAAPANDPMSAFPFTEGCALPVDNDGAALNLCAFDPSEELAPVWQPAAWFIHTWPANQLYSAFGRTP